MTYCPHFHIDRGESQCWAVVDNIGRHGMSIEQIQQYTRPTLCEDVLVCIDYRPDDPGTTEDTYVSIDHVDFNCFGQGEFSCERDDPRGGEPSPYFVTHWMPLPDPPKGE